MPAGDQLNRSAVTTGNRRSRLEIGNAQQLRTWRAISGKRSPEERGPHPHAGLPGWSPGAAKRRLCNGLWCWLPVRRRESAGSPGARPEEQDSHPGRQQDSSPAGTEPHRREVAFRRGPSSLMPRPASLHAPTPSCHNLRNPAGLPRRAPRDPTHHTVLRPQGWC